MKKLIIIVNLLLIGACHTYAQSNVKVNQHDSKIQFYKVNKLKKNTLSSRKVNGFIDFKKDSIFFLNIGICEEIFLKDFLSNKKTLKSSNALFNNQPAIRQLKKENINFYKSLYELNQKKGIIIKSLNNIEDYEKYFEAINYLIDSELELPDSISQIILKVRELAFSTYADNELSSLVDEILLSFSKNSHIYEFYLGPTKIKLFKEILGEMRLKRENNKDNIDIYRKKMFQEKLKEIESTYIIYLKKEEKELASIIYW